MTVDADEASDASPGGAGELNGDPEHESGTTDPPEADGRDRRADRDGAAHTSTGHFEAARALPHALQIAGSIIAPTTLLTALFAYFGLLYAIAYYRYFGINYTVLNLPVQGYLILSVSTAVLPLVLLASTALLSLWLYQLPLADLSEVWRDRLRDRAFPLLLVVGAFLVGAAATDAVLGVTMFPSALLEARGICLSIGVLVLGFAARLRRELSPPREERGDDRTEVSFTLSVAKWGSFSLLLGVGLFWAVGSYAIRMGTEGAQGFAAHLSCGPDVVVYSDKSLNLGFAGLHEEAAPASEEAGYRFRYPGLKLVPQAGESYLLVPSDWLTSGRPAIVLPRSDTVRLEFVVLRSRPPGC